MYILFADDNPIQVFTDYQSAKVEKTWYEERARVRDFQTKYEIGLVLEWEPAEWSEE